MISGHQLDLAISKNVACLFGISILLWFACILVPVFSCTSDFHLIFIARAQTKGERSVMRGRLNRSYCGGGQANANEFLAYWRRFTSMCGQMRRRKATTIEVGCYGFVLDFSGFSFLV